MNILNIDIKKYIPNIIDAYAEVLGEEYRNIIEERINNIIYVVYNTLDGVNDYYIFLKKCKRKELALKFLKQIGIDISGYEMDTYAEELDDDAEELITKYIDYLFFGINPDYKYDPIGIKSFRKVKDDSKSEETKSGQIEFLNFLRGSNVEPITNENFELFCETDEYRKLLARIESYLEIHDKILEEYEEYLKEIEPYKNFVDSETERRKRVFSAVRNELFNAVQEYIPFEIKQFLNNKYQGTDEKSNALLDKKIDIKMYVEYFSREDEEILNNPLTEEYSKRLIFYYRLLYLEQMGVLEEGSTKKSVWDQIENLYSKTIVDEKAKRLIPSFEFIETVTKHREEQCKIAEKTFIFNNTSFIKNALKFGPDPKNRDYIYARIKENRICISNGSNNYSNCVPILFYTVRSGDSGVLDYVWLHEILHSIEYLDASIRDLVNKCGFDYTFIERGNISPNPYNSEKRRYERLNETVTDIFSIEAVNILHARGIYMMEPKEINQKDANDYNTASIVKDLLKPFLTKYRTQIIKARMFTDMNVLLDITGHENFEELNDAINKVDYLVYQGLVGKLKEKQNNDEIVTEYNQQLSRIEQIYKNMETYNTIGATHI